MAYSRQGYVYFIHAPVLGLVKIGFSAMTPDERFDTLSTASPVGLERVALIRASISFERLLHHRFADHHSRLEWFDFGEPIARFVRIYASAWTRPIGTGMGSPTVAREDEIIRDDPWFRTTAARWARDWRGGRKSRKIDLLLKFPLTAEIVKMHTPAKRLGYVCKANRERPWVRKLMKQWDEMTVS